MEARLYAEDVGKGFLPATGRLDYLKLPEDKARIDSAVREGDEITPFYDPMIAKVIVHGDDREHARRKLVQALSAARIAGTVTNVSFLAALVDQRDFAAGDVDTGLIDRHLDQLIDAPSPSPGLWALASLSALNLMRTPSAQQGETDDPWSDQSGWRLWGKATHVTTLVLAQERSEVAVTIRNHADYSVTTPAGPCHLTQINIDGINVSASIDGAKIEASVLRLGNTITMFSHGRIIEWTVPDLSDDATESTFGEDQLQAPMPGLLKLLHTKAGESVARDQPLLVMEAMKMEHTLKAPRDGIVEQCFVSVGDQVEEGALLIQLQPEIDEPG